MFDDLLKKCKGNMEKTLEGLGTELSKMRVGRANPHVLDGVMVDYYGTKSTIDKVANVSVPEARLLVIKPWDGSMLSEIEKAINIANIGITPNNDGEVLRLSFPKPTEERRKELAKDAKAKGEESKISVRNIRRDILDEFKDMKESSEISEDQYRIAEDEVQEIVDEYNRKIDEKVENKVENIMSV